jgi:hypothetical protein
VHKSYYQQFVTSWQPFFDCGHQKVTEVFLVGTKRLSIREPFGFQVVEVDFISGNVGEDDLHLWRMQMFMLFSSKKIQSKKQDLEMKKVGVL